MVASDAVARDAVARDAVALDAVARDALARDSVLSELILEIILAAHRKCAKLIACAKRASTPILVECETRENRI